MTDDWSLKGKQVFEEIAFTYFEVDDIETLRQKLIEDMKEYMNGLGYIRYYDEIEMIKIINRRFGVETD